MCTTATHPCTDSLAAFALAESAEAAERSIPRYSRLLTEPEVPEWVKVGLGLDGDVFGNL
jgi:hypothetical protein